MPGFVSRLSSVSRETTQMIMKLNAIPLLRTAGFRACRQPHLLLRRTMASTSEEEKRNNNRVKIIEVGPRDGLQNEKNPVPFHVKVELIKRLSRTGVTAIEAGAFVSPEWVPQMADSHRVMENLLLQQHTTPVPMTYAYLVPNMKGLDVLSDILARHPNAFTTQRQMKFGQRFGVKAAIEVAVFTAATDEFSRKNLNVNSDVAVKNLLPVIEKCKELDLRVRAYISVVLGCPFLGYNVNPHKVADIARDLLEAGADEVSLGDTTGMGTAPRVGTLLKCMKEAGIRKKDIAMHFHDTYGQALVNTAVALEHGVRKFDSSVGGLGGCPYSPGATGNVATENMAYFLWSLGMETGIDLDMMSDIGAWIAGEVGRPNESTVGKATLARRERLRTKAEKDKAAEKAKSSRLEGLRAR